MLDTIGHRTSLPKTIGAVCAKTARPSSASSTKYGSMSQFDSAPANSLRLFSHRSLPLIVCFLTKLRSDGQSKPTASCLDDERREPCQSISPILTAWLNNKIKSWRMMASSLLSRICNYKRLRKANPSRMPTLLLLFNRQPHDCYKD